MLSVTPTHPLPGSTMTICYSFADGQASPVDIGIDWSPSSLPDGTASVSREENCVAVGVPDSATSCVLTADGAAPLAVSMGLGS